MQSFGTDLLIEAYVKVAAEIRDHGHFWTISVWQIVILTSHESALYIDGNYSAHDNEG